MKSIILSCTPPECERIVNGDISILVRKKVPHISNLPFKVYVYCTRAKSKWRYYDYEGAYQNSKGEIVYAQQQVIGEFICDRVDEWECKNRLEILESFPQWRASYMFFIDDLEKTCLTYDDLWDYGEGKTLYGWHISDLKIYDRPRALSEFRACNGSCNHCKHRVVNPNDVGDVRCENKITRPPKNYIYVEE